MMSQQWDNPLASDLDGVLAAAADDLRALRGAQLFITGGTGFVGTWLLESFTWANRTLDLGAEATVLTRHPHAFAKKAPHLAADPAVRLVRADVSDLSAVSGPFTHVIHAAAELGNRQGEPGPLQVVDTTVGGTRNVLEAAHGWGVQDVLFVSSGAVYGPQPGDLRRVPEDWMGGPDPLAVGSAYAESKRLAELLGGIYSAQYGMRVKTARCFAFVGPYMSLDSHFAIGNFVRDGLAGGPIVVRGDGTPIRSYLYAADLAAWLWGILARGASGRAYNVGSEEELSVAQIAGLVAKAFDPEPAVVIATRADLGGAGGGDCYVPSTARARTELGLKQTVNIADAVARTIGWNRHAISG
jgi:nucleoside-diphosphate-sugar epimerase